NAAIRAGRKQERLRHAACSAWPTRRRPMRRTLWLIAALAMVPGSARSARANEFDVPVPAGGSPRLESIGYEPRRYRAYHHEPSGGSAAVSQLHAGLFDPEEFSSAGFLIGFRGGAAIDDHVQFGVDIDWRFKSEQETEVVSSQGLPNGGAAQVKRVLSQAASNLVPILGYVQIGAGHDLPLSPYVGAGAGYEAYFLSADDFSTGS